MSSYIYTYINSFFFNSNLQAQWLAAKVIRQDQLKAIQESIAEFLNDQVIDSKGEFHYDPTQPWKLT
jgi:hypothetical protein